MEVEKGVKIPEIPECILKMRKTVQIASIAKICSGAALMIIGIITLAIMKSNSGFPFTSGSPIWSGAIALTAGIFGYLVTREAVPTLDTFNRLRCFVGVYYGLCISITSTSGINIGYSISAIVKCTEDTCADDDTFMIVIMAFSAALGLVCFVCGIYGNAFYCKARSIFYNRK